MTTITIDRSVVEQALEAFEAFLSDELRPYEAAKTAANIRAAMAQQTEPEGGGNLPPPLQAEPVAWRCACGANLYIGADGAPRSKAEPVQEPQTLDAAMQQPRAMAQAYENGYKAGAAAEREACAKLAEATICDTHLPTGVRIYGTRVADAIRARSNT